MLLLYYAVALVVCGLVASVIAVLESYINAGLRSVEHAAIVDDVGHHILVDVRACTTVRQAFHLD